jgi:polysaccharide chain length determinant protein (PEP-CTERM system associated)
MAGCGIAAAVTYAWPPTYKSEALILVESQRIPQAFVAATVSDDLKERLSNLSIQILAYSRLLEIIKKFDLYHKERQTHAEEEIVEMMRGDIQVDLQKGWSQDRPGAFRISYEGRNADVVALVTNELGNLFIEENLRAREIQATGTSEFLDNQLAEAKKKLEEQEAQLSQFKREHEGELPEQENSLIAGLNRLQLQLQGVQDALSRAQQNKMLIEDSLQTGQATLATMTRIAQRSDALANSSGDGAGDDARFIKQIQTRLEELRTKYTEDHPDVQSAKAELAEAKKRLAEQEKADEAVSKTPAGDSIREQDAAIEDASVAASLAGQRERLSNLKAQEKATVKQIETLGTERQQILEHINSLQVRVDHLPVREQQLAAVRRDYDITKANYQALLEKEMAAGMAADMEKRQKSERFAMLEPARVPELPSKPNRPLVAGVGALLSLLIAAGFVIARAIQENFVLGEWELPKEALILARVPVISPSRSESSRTALFGGYGIRRIATALFLLLVICGVGTGLYFHWISF